MQNKHDKSRLNACYFCALTLFNNQKQIVQKDQHLGGVIFVCVQRKFNNGTTQVQQ